jgi:hypothetical protein
MSYKPYEKRTVDAKQIRPHAIELVRRCGNWQETAEYAGIGKSTIARIYNGANERIQMATARKILMALERRREEDRKNYSVNQRLIKAKRDQAKLEDNIERLAGY